jgi:hypothetical protein
MDKKRKREEIKRMTKGVPGNYVQNQKSQVFEDRRTKRNRSRTDKKRNAFRDYRDEIKNEEIVDDDQDLNQTSE